MPKGKILIVEDKLSNIRNAYEALTNRGYEVDVAFDLSQATKLLDSQKYSGVITDMCFEEEGIYFNGYDRISSKEESPEIKSLVYKSLEDKDGLLEFLENNNEIRKQFDASLGNSIYLESVRGKNSPEKISELIKVSDNAPGLGEMVKHTKELGKYLGHHGADSVENIKRGHRDGNKVESAESCPAFGYYVIKKANEKGIPVSVISHTGHSRHAISGVLASGVTNVKELGYHLSNVGNFIPNYDLDGDGAPRIIESFRSMGRWRGKKIILDKVIFTSNEKSPHLYDQSLEQILGDIDKNRMYKIDTGKLESNEDIIKRLGREFVESRYPENLEDYDKKSLSSGKLASYLSKMSTN